jgi:hypothetical protein
MTNKRLLPLVALAASTVLVVALVGVLVLALGDEEQAQDGEPSLVRPAPGTVPGQLPEVSAPAGDVAAAVQPPTPIDTPITQIGPEMIIGRVLDELTGEPVAAFQVTILPHASEPALERLERAEVNPVPVRAPSGIFRFERDPGRWDVVVRAPTYEPFVLSDVRVPREDGTPTDIALSHGPSLTGLVHDQHNFAVANAQVFLKVSRLFDDAPRPKRLTTRTDEHGRFRFSPLPAGEYALTLLEPDNPTDRLGGILVDGGTTDVTVFLAPRHKLIVSVQDGYGRPVRGAGVELSSADQHANGRTSPSGQVLLNWLQDGVYSVTVGREGYETIHEEIVLEGGQSEMVRWFTLRSDKQR